jgi:acrylyl-CoA reductase (NADPH)
MSSKMSRKFKALVANESNGKYSRIIEERKIDDLPAGEVLILVKYSALNYKDALSASGNKGVTKKYPHTPGIDAAGIVEESSSALFLKGEKVLVTGYDLGMNTSGGFAEYIRVPAAWVVKLPENLTLRESMILGTAGFTAGLGLFKLRLNGLKENGDVVITGATGGVGSIGTAIFSKAGYNVTASTGSLDRKDFLLNLGAKNILPRQELELKERKPMMSGKWDGALDTVGGDILATVIAQTKTNCSVAACGLVSSNILNTTVYPFIIRGVNLLGINSAETPMDIRLQVWEKLSTVWKPDNLDYISTEITLEELDPYIDKILEGKTTGKILIKCSE